MVSEPPLSLPLDLLTAAQDGRLVLFVGAGVSRPDYPSWAGMVELLIKRAEEYGLDTNRARQYGASGNHDRAAGSLRREMGTHRFWEAMCSIFRRWPEPPLRPRHLAIARTHYAAILTTNYEKSLERAHISLELSLPVYTNQSVELGGLPARQDPFILKVHGDIDDMASWVVTREDYRARCTSNAAYVNVLRTLALTRPFLFAGYSLSDPYLVRILRDLRSLHQGMGPPSFASRPLGPSRGRSATI